jgi:hypothetical protein
MAELRVCGWPTIYSWGRVIGCIGGVADAACILIGQRAKRLAHCLGTFRGREHRFVRFACRLPALGLTGSFPPLLLEACPVDEAG